MTDQNGVQLSQVVQISLTVGDVPRAVPFYRYILGMKFLFQAPNLAFFDCGGLRLMLTLPEGVAPHQNSVLYFKVPDIEGAHRGLASKGVSFEDQPHRIARMPDHDLWMTHFRDLDRNLLALMSEVRRPA